MNNSLENKFRSNGFSRDKSINLQTITPEGAGSERAFHRFWSSALRHEQLLTKFYFIFFRNTISLLISGKYSAFLMLQPRRRV
jgi:hypothetical protein